MSENPWWVENIKEFSFLNCPECPFKAKKEITFTNHAMKNHPLSSVFFGTNSDMVILEEVEEEGTIQGILDMVHMILVPALTSSVIYSREGES